MKHSEAFFAQHLSLIKRRYPVHQRVKCNPLDGVPLADAVLLTLGGKFKFKETLSGRFADILIHLYLASAVVRARFQDR